MEPLRAGKLLLQCKCGKPFSSDEMLEVLYEGRGHDPRLGVFSVNVRTDGILFPIKALVRCPFCEGISDPKKLKNLDSAKNFETIEWNDVERERNERLLSVEKLIEDIAYLKRFSTDTIRLAELTQTLKEALEPKRCAEQTVDDQERLFIKALPIDEESIRRRLISRNWDSDTEELNLRLAFRGSHVLVKDQVDLIASENERRLITLLSQQKPAGYLLCLADLSRQRKDFSGAREYLSQFQQVEKTDLDLQLVGSWVLLFTEMGHHEREFLVFDFSQHLEKNFSDDQIKFFEECLFDHFCDRAKLQSRSTLITKKELLRDLFNVAELRYSSYEKTLYSDLKKFVLETKLSHAYARRTKVSRGDLS